MMYNILIIFSVILTNLIVTTIYLKLIATIHKPSKGKRSKTHFKLKLAKNQYLELDCETNYNTSCKDETTEK